GRYTDMGKDHTEGIEAIKNDLTLNIARTFCDLQDEVKYAVGREIGECAEWTPINIYSRSLQIGGLASGRIFVGLPLCRDQEWVDKSISYAIDTMAGIRAVNAYSPLLCPFVAPFLPELRKLRSYKRRAAQMLPFGHAKSTDNLSLETGNYEAASDANSKQFNLISWMIGHSKDIPRVQPEFIAKEQLFAAFGAIHVTSITVTNALYDLAAHPEYIAPLRAEIDEVIAEEEKEQNASSDIEQDRSLGLRKQSLPKLRKLDSFLKESQRMNPLSISTSFQSLLVHHFVITGRDNINFSHGPGACPGRFFASAVIKAILVEVIGGWDVGLAEGGTGEVEGEGLKRPVTTVLPGGQRTPDARARIWFRRRKDGRA
ncbi:MAG: hypothetical protein Q9214_002582, partial [Letrouitia sp. 1 TL-2023]